MPFLMIRNDLTKVNARAIVNPANKDLCIGTGTSEAVYIAAGIDKLTEACNAIGHCDLGKAVITDAFNLPAKYIIHAVGPKWIDGKHDEEKYLYSAYKESMLLAKKYNLDSIAFPLLSSGNYGYPKEQALNIAIKAIKDFLEDNEMLIYLVLYDKDSVSISKKLYSDIEEYIDDHYIDEERIWEYIPQEELFDLKAYHHLLLHHVPIKKVITSVPPVAHATISIPNRSLEDIISGKNETFTQMLFRLIDERQLKDPYVYKKANLSKEHFSKIRSGMNPSKKTVFALAISLELSLDETTDLLMRAGFAFSVCSKFDIIVRYFIENGKYDIFEINAVLCEYNQPSL